MLSDTAKLKKSLARFLGTLARTVLRARQPVIVGITGSVGKSSAKEAIALVLSLFSGEL
jgi:UDP-N-acetylmuramyl pentapeptide synthase